MHDDIFKIVESKTFPNKQVFLNTLPNCTAAELLVYLSQLLINVLSIVYSILCQSLCNNIVLSFNCVVIFVVVTCV